MIRTKKLPTTASDRSLVDRIREKGLRLTEQRRIVADVLERANDHLDVESVLKLAQKKDPTIHQATVYRALNALKQAGLVDELDLMHVEGGRHYYEIRPSKFHIHLVCTTCGFVDEPDGSFWENFQRRLENETGFKPEVMRMEMGGTCKACRGRKE